MITKYEKKLIMNNLADSTLAGILLLIIRLQLNGQ